VAGQGAARVALTQWTGLFVDFLVTKPVLAAVLQSDDPMHSYFLDRLLPVRTQSLDAAAKSGEICPGQDSYEFLRGVASFCQAPETIPATTHAGRSGSSSRDYACRADSRPGPGRHGQAAFIPSGWAS